MLTILQSLLGEKWVVNSLRDYPDFDEPEESGKTYLQNAIIKAEAARDATGEWCIADDAGLEIDFLNGQPGVKSKRFAGEDTPFSEKIARILTLMNDVAESGRTARFRCAVAIAIPAKDTRVFESIRTGSIAAAPVGEHGFGYDPIFLLPEIGRTYAELEPEHKNEISHRGMVLREAAAWLLTQG